MIVPRDFSFIILGTLLLALISAEAKGNTSTASSSPSLQNPIYFGVFGGGGTFSANSITQSATILADPPFAAKATGSGSTDSVGVIGGYIGYKWPKLFSQKENSNWTFIPSTELEGYYLKGTQTGENINDATIPTEVHSFSISYPMNTGVFLINTVLNLNHTNSNFHPYVGVGLGAAIVSINNANSTQVSPPEVGMNHYNSDPNASDWTFAAQSKVGLRFNVTPHSSIFAEYRFLYLAPTEYTFGSTQYSTHRPTTNWIVDLGSMCYNMGTIGIQYDM